MVVYVAGFPAIYGRQPLYFQDPVFQARAEVPAPGKSDTLEPPPEDGPRAEPSVSHGKRIDLGQNLLKTPL